MKALSIKQPWAELILEGRKKIELRKWNTKFRGEFLIHSSKIPDTQSMKRFGFHDLPNGFILGQVELTGVKTYSNDKELIEDKDLHLSERQLGNKGFILKNPKRIKKIEQKGSLGFWEFKGKVIKDNQIKLADSPEEIQKIYQYLESLNLEYPNYKKWIKKCKKELKSNYKKAFYTQKNTTIIGIILFQLHKTKASLLEIKTFFVTPKNRKKGVGSQLYLSIEQYAIDKKFTSIQADTHNQTLLNFLLKKDFKIIKKEKLYSPSQIEIVLQKNLQKIK